MTPSTQTRVCSLKDVLSTKCGDTQGQMEEGPKHEPPVSSGCSQEAGPESVPRAWTALQYAAPLTESSATAAVNPQPAPWSGDFLSLRASLSHQIPSWSHVRPLRSQPRACAEEAPSTPSTESRHPAITGQPQGLRGCPPGTRDKEQPHSLLHDTFPSTDCLP